MPESLASLFVPPPAKSPLLSWVYVEDRFNTLRRNLAVSPDQMADGRKKAEGVVASLNRALRDSSVPSDFSYVGSWAKVTAVHPPSDVDILYIPPLELYHRFNLQAWNGQSALLQHIKDILGGTYSQTRMRGDGQVVVVDFNSITVEVVPAFHAQGGGFLICDTHDGGKWKHVDSFGEIAALDNSDANYRGNVRKLTQMMKQWKRHCDVPIKSFHLEQLVVETLQASRYGTENEFYFDWLARDIFAHMVGRAGGGFHMPGLVVEWIDLGSDWLSRAETAHRRACKACDYERANKNESAGEEWQKIFGTVIPRAAH